MQKRSVLLPSDYPQTYWKGQKYSPDRIKKSEIITGQVRKSETITGQNQRSRQKIRHIHRAKPKVETHNQNYSLDR